MHKCNTKLKQELDRALIELGKKAVEIADLKASFDDMALTCLEVETQRDNLRKKLNDELEQCKDLLLMSSENLDDDLENRPMRHLSGQLSARLHKKISEIDSIIKNET